MPDQIPVSPAPTQEAPKADANVQTAPEQAKKVEQEARKYKLKINGSEREYDEASVMALAQKGAAADEKFQKASAAQKSTAELAKLWESDPERALRELGKKDPVELAKAIIQRELNKMSMTPEQIELHEAKEKLKVFEEEKKTRQEEQRKAAEAEATKYFVKQYDTEIPRELAKVGLPVNEDTVRYTAEIMLANLESGYEMPYEVVMSLVKDKFSNSFKGFASKIDPSKLVELLGEDVINKLIASAPKKEKEAIKQAIQADSPKSERTNNYETKDEFRKRIEEWSRK